MKFRRVDKVELFAHLQYYEAKKYGAIIQLKIASDNKYHFSVRRKEDDFTFYSLWDFSEDPLTQERISKLPSMRFPHISDAFDFVEKWVNENVPKLKIIK